MNNSFAALICAIIGVGILITFPDIRGLNALGVFSLFSFGFLWFDQKGNQKETVKDKRIEVLEKRVEELEKRVNPV